MTLLVLADEFAVARLGAAAALPSWAAEGPVSSVTRTAEELSIVCAAANLPGEVMAERGWRCLRVAGCLDFSATGVLASIAAPLADAGVSLFALSTYDTDYILVRTEALHTAIAALTHAGHEVRSA